jgi:tetratricopeptide (TPR) repeat protein
VSRSPGEKEIAELADAFRRNPRGTGFLPLASAYLATGRPREAMGVLGQGLTMHPDNVEARMLMARAQLSIKQVGEAQAQLLQAVELDPGNVEAFVLLSEVCSQAEDFERARLSLEQACDLRPDDPDLRSRLEAAKRGEMPPAPVETLGRMTLEKKGVRPAQERSRAAPAPATTPEPPRRSLPRSAVEAPFAPLDSERSERPPSPRPVPSAERPRISATPHKEKDKGAGDMRRSAAVERDYLGDLLAGGLLDVPNVTARPQKDPRRARRIGKRIAQLVGVVALGAAIWGGVTYGPALLRGGPKPVPAAASAALTGGGDVAVGIAACDQALTAHADAEGPLGARAALLALSRWELGGEGEGQVDAAIAAAGAKLDGAPVGTPGQRELALARAVRELSRGDLASARLAVERAGTDPTARWIDGHVRLASGDAAAARVAWEQAGTAGAWTALGELALDGGDLAAAKAAYDKALALDKDHPFGLIGRALTTLESGGDPTAALDDLVGVEETLGARVAAWKSLALASAHLVLDSPDKATEEMATAAKRGISEARFVLRLALLHAERGEVAETARLRGLVPEKLTSGLGLLVDAELALWRGRPADALAAVETRGDRRGRMARARALIDLGRAKDAVATLEPAMAAFPSDMVLGTWLDLAQALADPGSGKAVAALERRARASVSTFPRAALGWAEWRRGNGAEARRDLEQSREGHPLAYRTHALLAEIALAEGNPDAALKSARTALDAAPEFMPAHALVGRALVRLGKPKDALASLEPVLALPRTTAVDELALAEALMLTGKKDRARELLDRAAKHGASAEELARIGAL